MRFSRFCLWFFGERSVLGEVFGEVRRDGFFGGWIGTRGLLDYYLMGEVEIGEEVVEQGGCLEVDLGIKDEVVHWKGFDFGQRRWAN